ncbi:MAG: formylglycine-generating enzyme family protein [Spirochaetes bacterium]|nr:formylglycine-generating enzyme family protein [Spirochaetota bacterium]MBU1080510.1 formylglycine-generating enzyme family protein [Spirochaetota bacterium]
MMVGTRKRASYDRFGIIFLAALLGSPVAWAQAASGVGIAGAPSSGPRGEAFVKGGSFRMGSDYGGADERPARQVSVRDFYIMRTEVTQADYESLTGSNPSEFKDGAHPVERVGWYDAVAYANALSVRDGLQPAYAIDGTSVSCDFDASGWRLPTEAEWEYAARGGLARRGYAYAGGDDPARVSWYGGDSGGSTGPVGTKAPNELGLYDMSGNVYEWCWDWYGSYVGQGLADPRGPAAGDRRSRRGGCYLFNEEYLRPSYRSYEKPEAAFPITGFRLARRP